MSRPSPSRVASSRGTMPMISPLYITAIRSDKRHDLVQFRADQKHCHAFVALGHDLVVDELDGADIDATRRLRSDQQIERA